MRAWRSKILKRTASRLLFLYLSYSSSRYEATRCSFTTRYIYIYIIGSPRTHLLFVSVHGELIIEAFRSSFFFVVCRRRVDEDEFFVYHFIREEDQYFVIFIELGEKKKLSFIGHRWNGQYRKTNYFELWNCALIMYDWFESRIKEILTLIVAHNCSIQINVQSEYARFAEIKSLSKRSIE